MGKVNKFVANNDIDSILKYISVMQALQDATQEINAIMNVMKDPGEWDAFIRMASKENPVPFSVLSRLLEIHSKNLTNISALVKKKADTITLSDYEVKDASELFDKIGREYFEKSKMCAYIGWKDRIAEEIKADLESEAATSPQ